jgi:hypothetical protein
MGLFNLLNNQVVIDPSVLPIPEFKKLWDRDKTKGKDSAFKELSYVYYVTDFNSPYSNIPEEKRSGIIRDDFMKDPKWKPDEAIEEAIVKYRMLTRTPTMFLVEAVKESAYKLADYLKNSEPDSKTTKTIMETVDKLGKFVASYSKLNEAVQREQAAGGRTFGDKKIGEYER